MRNAAWNIQMEKDRQVLKCILAMIFYLAGIFGSDLPRPFRLYILRVLRPAGPAARECMASLTPQGLAPVMEVIATRHGDPAGFSPMLRMQAIGYMLASLASIVRNIARAQARRFAPGSRSSALGAARDMAGAALFIPVRPSPADALLARSRSPPMSLAATAPQSPSGLLPAELQRPHLFPRTWQESPGMRRRAFSPSLPCPQAVSARLRP